MKSAGAGLTGISLWMTWGVASVAVAFAGPFGTFSAESFLWRLGYWGSAIACAIIFGLVFGAFWRDVLRERADWKQDVATALSMALTFGALVVWTNRRLSGLAPAETMATGVTLGAVFVISYGVIAALRVVETFEQDSAGCARDRLLARIDAPKSARLARISSDNHHIRIMTLDGAEHRILMRMRDAVQEVDVEPGLWVHRSHWVANAAIVEVSRDGTREILTLTCGSEIPVGPKYRDNLIHAGVINP